MSNAAIDRRGVVPSDDGTRLLYRIQGSGPPLVLVAGLGDDAASWDTVAADLARSFTVVAFDNRGIGGSDKPAGPYSVARLADDAHALVAGLGLAPVIAMGSSMGGAICQRWAIRHPADITRLVISNSWGEPDVFTDALFAHWIAMARGGLGRHIVESLLSYCYSPDYLAAHPATVPGFLGSTPPDLAGFEAAAWACRGHDTREEASHIVQPTLVIAGRHDILTRAELSYRLAGRIPGARSATLDTGHMVFWEQPEPFCRLVKEFINADAQ